MFEMVLPTWTPFTFSTQWDVYMIANHISSTPWEILIDRTPYDVAIETLRKDIFKVFQLKLTTLDEVNLTPKLICFKH